VPPIINDILQRAGEPLEQETRSLMESRFGQDFSGVRVHADSQAGESARAIDASAYTVGSDVVFGSGHYQPKTGDGRKLLAHELTHVVQQRDARRDSGALPVEPPDSQSERVAEATSNAIMSSEHVPELGAVGRVQIARAPAPSDQRRRNFEGALMFTVELPLGTDTPDRLGYEKDFHGYLPKQIVENDNRWHAAHAVGPIVGVELEEGILLAPRGVNLSLQKGIENHIRKIREIAPKGSRLELHIEYAAHPGTRRLSYINYELRLIHGGANESPLSASLTVSNDIERPSVAVSVTSPMGGEASRTYADAINIRKERGAADDRPLTPRSSAPATYSSTASTTKRHQVPDAEVYKTRPPSTSANAASSTSGATKPASPPAMPASSQRADSSPQSVPPAQTPRAASPSATQTTPPPQVAAPSKPSAPPSSADRADKSGAQTPAKPAQAAVPTVGKPFQTPSNAMEAAEARAAAKGNAAVLALAAYGELFRNLGDSIQQKAAETRFRELEPQILNELDKNPGMGAIVEFVFVQFKPDPTGESVLKPGDLFQDVYWSAATSRTDIQPAVFPVRANSTLHIRRRWIPATHQAAPRGDQTRKDDKPPIVVDESRLDAALAAVHEVLTLSPTQLLIAFKDAAPPFGGDAHVHLKDFRNEVHLQMSNGVYFKALPKLEAAAVESLTAQLNNLESDLKELRAKYTEYRNEDWFIKILKQREFDMPPPQLLDSGDERVKLGRDWLVKNDFAMARKFLVEGKERARKVRFLFFNYVHGQPHPLEDL
jgi:hypothetical protein